MIEVPFAADAQDMVIPDVWSCRRHGREDCTRVGLDGRQRGRALSQRAQLDHDGRRRGAAIGRTHWVMLTERRSEAELQDLLDERLSYLARCRRAGVRPELAPRGSGTVSAIR